jgi:hypothetical protein
MDRRSSIDQLTMEIVAVPVAEDRQLDSRCAGGLNKSAHPDRICVIGGRQIDAALSKNDRLEAAGLALTRRWIRRRRCRRLGHGDTDMCTSPSLTQTRDAPDSLPYRAHTLTKGGRFKRAMSSSSS